MFLYSILIVFLSYSIVLIVKRRLFTYIVVTLLWSIIGIVNWMMLNTRNTPFTYVDITLLKSVLPVMSNYFTPMEIVSMGALILIALVLLVVAFMYLPMEKKLKRKKGFLQLSGDLCGFLRSYGSGISTGDLTDQIHNILLAFNDYGTSYCFAITALKNGIDKPSNYSQKKIDSIMKETNQKVEEKEKANKTVKKPNIIFVQLESHFDITQVKA